MKNRHTRNLFYLALCFSTIIWFFLGMTTETKATEALDIPILRIETGMHTNVIRRVGVDDSGRWLVTASKDDTVRIWELPSGRLDRIIRLPIVGDGRSGGAAVAISPDGKMVACGVYRKFKGDSSYPIFVFDRSTGGLIHRIAGFSEANRHLAFSPDGKFLMAALGGKEGIRVFQTKEWKIVAQDDDYGEKSLFAAFDRQGRLATTSFDGFLRLYDAKLNLIAKVKAPGGKQPGAVAISPDGERIAVGFADTNSVNIFSGHDLSHLYNAITSGLGNCRIYSVTWSRDGRYLYAGGTCARKINGEYLRVIRRWSSSSRWSYKNFITSADNSIQHIQPLPDGGVVFSGSMSFGVLDKEGKEVLFRQGDTADYRGMFNEFLLSSDGSTVQLAYEKEGKSPACFNIPSYTLDTNARKDGEIELLPPLSDAPGLSFSDWRHSLFPKLNLKPLKLDPNEISRSRAITPKGEAFLLGTEWAIRLFDRNGTLIWNTKTPGVAWAVNISGNGKLAVAALSDGTIRWYRMSDGKELLAFFPHIDRQRWVVWTPGGYYNASEGADEIIGWLVNNGKDKEASFYPASRFFDEFYRPDVVAEVIQSGEPDDVVVARLGGAGKTNLLAGIRKPPNVTILSPLPGQTFNTESIDVTVSAEDMGGGVDEIRLYVNGKIAGEDARGVRIKPQRNAKEETFSIKLTKGENRILATAFSNDRIEANPVELKVTFRGTARFSELHLGIIGINTYQNSDLNLNYAEADAVGIEQFFAKPEVQKLFPSVHVYKCLNAEATADNIRRMLKEIQGKAKTQDTVLLYLAGHGDTVGTEWYFVPHDVTTPEMEGELKKGGISTREITAAIKSFPAQKIFLILDSCKSGGVLMAMRGYEERKALLQLARSTGTYILSASTDRQSSSEFQQLGHGALTYLLLEGLGGKAGGSKVTVERLIAYVKNRLPDITEKYRGAPQYPVSWGTGMDFPLVVYE